MENDFAIKNVRGSVAAQCSQHMIMREDLCKLLAILEKEERQPYQSHLCEEIEQLTAEANARYLRTQEAKTDLVAPNEARVNAASLIEKRMELLLHILQQEEGELNRGQWASDQTLTNSQDVSTSIKRNIKVLTFDQSILHADYYKDVARDSHLEADQSAPKGSAQSITFLADNLIDGGMMKEHECPQQAGPTGRAGVLG